jgi:hypothetical protein
MKALTKISIFFDGFTSNEITNRNKNNNLLDLQI